MKSSQGYTNVEELAHDILTQNTLNKGQPASGATFLLLEFLLALLVSLLLELLALRNNGAIRSVGFRQRRSTANSKPNAYMVHRSAQLIERGPWISLLRHRAHTRSEHTHIARARA